MRVLFLHRSQYIIHKSFLHSLKIIDSKINKGNTFLKLPQVIMLISLQLIQQQINNSRLASTVVIKVLMQRPLWISDKEI